MDEKELKPCPFCGATEFEVDADQVEHNSHSARIDCDSCETSFSTGYTERSEALAIDKVRAAWNRRAAPSDAAQAPQPKPRLLNHLRRFNECCEDFEAGGHDVDKEDMHALADLGAVRPAPGGRYYMTDFGRYLLAAPVALAAVAPSEHCNLCEQAYDPACQECHTSSMAARLTEQNAIIRELQKALAYWMPKVFDDRSAHDAYLLVGYDGEDEVGYWDQREAAQSDERAACDKGDFYDLLTAYGEACHLMTNSKRITEAKDAVLAAFARATAPQATVKGDGRANLEQALANKVNDCNAWARECANLRAENAELIRRAAAPQAGATLADEQITAVWNSMPGGYDGFLKSWGYIQFARALIAAYPTEQAEN